MITILKDDDRIVIDGHAGYAPTGCDIVCSAISVLTETLVASLEELTYDEITCRRDEGFTEIEYEKGLSEKSKLLIRSFFIGANGVADSYPEYVRII